MNHYLLFFVFLGLCRVCQPLVLSAETTSVIQQWEKERLSLEERLKTIESPLTNHERRELQQTSFRNRHWLLPKLRGLSLERRDLKQVLLKNEQKKKLYGDILLLGVVNEAGQTEAAWIADVLIESIHDLKKKYRMLRPAFLHNSFVNLHLKTRGLCWHWTDDLSDRLAERTFKGYTISWGVARKETPREHNSVVIHPKTADFTEGLVVDPWRHAGKPYWVRLKKDHYPWEKGRSYSRQAF